MSSFSKSAIITDLSRFTLTTFLLSNAAEGLLKTGSSLYLCRESTSDADIFLSLIVGWDCLLDLLGTVLIRKWACLSRLPSPLCNGKVLPWQTGSLGQAIEAERGLLWLSVVFEVRKANSLWRSPLIMFHSVHCWAPTKDTDLAARLRTWLNYTLYPIFQLFPLENFNWEALGI